MDDCWIYDGQGQIGPKGYGQAYVGRRKGYVHRLVYEALVGPIPPGMHIDHLCRIRSCYNPKHLEAVTPGENLHRSLAARDAYAKHGTRSKYNTGCRCPECRAAAARDARDRYRAIKEPA